MACCPGLRPDAALRRQWVVDRYRTVEVETQHLAVSWIGVLGGIGPHPVPDREEEVAALGREGDDPARLTAAAGWRHIASTS